MEIYCCGCKKNVIATLTSGKEIYPHRADLFELPFWECKECNNYVGCHHKSKDRTKPLGNIPTAEIRNARKHIHSILDPMWKNKRIKRASLYRKISEELGYEYHTGEIKSIQEARKVYKVAMVILNRLESGEFAKT